MTELDWLNEEVGGESADSSLGFTKGGVTEHRTATSKYCVKTDKWGQRKGKDLANSKGMKDLGMDEHDCSDIFGMSFNFEPELHEATQCENPTRHQFLDALRQDPNYEALHLSTQMDVLASELASTKFAEEYTQYRSKREEEQKEQDGQPGDGPGKPGKGKGQPDPKQQAREQLKQEMQAASAAAKAAEAATKEVQDLKDAQQAFGLGMVDASNPEALDVQEVRKIYNKVKNNYELKRIIELAGKYRLMARSKQRTKTIHGQDDLVGIELNNKIPRMLAIELAKMAHPALQFDAVKRFAQREMLCRKYSGVEKQAKGPIIVAIDESGSMRGEKICQAKALALAMAQIARWQKRWCAFIAWGSESHLRSIALPPNRWPTADVMQWLSQFLNSGSTHLPVEATPRLYDELGAPKGKTDLIIVTDGQTERIDPIVMKEFKNWKKAANCKLIGVSIQSPADVLQSISDEFYRVTNLDVTSDAVGQALSI